MTPQSSPTLAMKVVSRRAPAMSPLGTAERRRHRVFCTRFTEYHLRDDECVGVRDRESGEWMRDHAALRLHAVQIPPRGQDRTWIGRRLQFWGSRADVMTSPVVEVGRPQRPSLDRYISHVCSGEILG